MHFQQLFLQLLKENHSQAASRNLQLYVLGHVRKAGITHESSGAVPVFSLLEMGNLQGG